MSSTLTEQKIALRRPVSARDEMIAPVPVEIPGPTAPPPAGPPALHLEHVTKTFVVGRKRKPVVAVDDVSLRVEPRTRSTGSSGRTGAASPPSSAS